MSKDGEISRHESYHNRFRTSSSSGGDTPAGGHPGERASLGHFPSQSHPPLQIRHSEPQKIITIHEQPRRSSEVVTLHEQTSTETSTDGGAGPSHETQNEAEVPKPAAPGQPRRLSRQISAGAKRQKFAAARSVSAGGRSAHSTSLESSRDDVFVELDVDTAGQQRRPSGLYDSSLFTHDTFRKQVLSTSSSTASRLVNPYNNINHRLHDTVWFCNCLYFVFFCCLPAVHFMEQSDVHFRLNDDKKAKRLGTVSSILYLAGGLLTVLFFGLIFFLAIYFTTQ